MARTRMANLLLHLHRRWAAWLLVLAVRLALAVLLVPSGVEKLLGLPFPRRSMEPWAMPFFDMLHSVGPYWRFLGLVQIVAGVCLLVPRFATLGALAALAISVELLVITSALHFRATAVFAAALMVTASAGLLLWDWPRLAPLVAAPDLPGGSVRATLTSAWQRREVRAGLAGIAALWLLVHLLDRAGLL